MAKDILCYLIHADENKHKGGFLKMAKDLNHILIFYCILNGTDGDINFRKF